MYPLRSVHSELTRSRTAWAWVRRMPARGAAAAHRRPGGAPLAHSHQVTSSLACRCLICEIKALARTASMNPARTLGQTSSAGASPGSSAGASPGYAGPATSSVPRSRLCLSSWSVACPRQAERVRGRPSASAEGRARPRRAVTCASRDKRERAAMAAGARAA